MSFYKLAVVTAALGLAAPVAASGRALLPPERFIIEAAVKDSLTDPKSAMFKHFPIVTSANVYCAMVNSKNRLGGYGGFSVFSVAIKRSPVGRVTSASLNIIMDEGSLDEDRPWLECRNAGYDVPVPTH